MGLLYRLFASKTAIIEAIIADQIEAQIAQAEAQAIKEVRGAAVDLAIDAARNIIAAELQGGKGDGLVDRPISEIRRNLH